MRRRGREHGAERGVPSRTTSTHTQRVAQGREHAWDTAAHKGQGGLGRVSDLPRVPADELEAHASADPAQSEQAGLLGWAGWEQAEHQATDSQPSPPALHTATRCLVRPHQSSQPHSSAFPQSLRPPSRSSSDCLISLDDALPPLSVRLAHRHQRPYGNGTGSFGYPLPPRTVAHWHVHATSIVSYGGVLRGIESSSEGNILQDLPSTPPPSGGTG